MSQNNIEVIVDNKPVPALVDSGASFSVISEKYRRLLKKVMFPATNNVLLKVANGNYVKPVGKCTLRLEISGRPQAFVFTVLPQCSHDVILGWDFLRASQAVINCGRSEVLFQDIIEESQTPDSSRLFTLEDYTVPARSIKKISVIGRENLRATDVIVEANKMVHLNKGVSVPSTIVTLVNGKAELWVANGQEEPQILPKGMYIGKMEPLCKDCVNIISEGSPISANISEAKSDVIDYSKMIAADLSIDRKQEILQVLYKFSEIFDQEKTFKKRSQHNVKHRINTGDHLPISQRAYRVSPSERRIISEEVTKMLGKGVIQPSESPWSSPVVLVRKKDGSWRFCVDYRRLNKITKKDLYPLPRIDDTLDCLKGAKYFSSMDLSSGYWQIEVDEADREKTAFITPEGLYEFKVMPFGLCNAPATFERMMDNLLRHLKWTMCLCYLDDIVVFSETFDEHLRRLTTVLQCIQDAGLVLNPKKCRFGAQEIKILGHLVSSDGVRPDPEKVKAVSDFPVPRNIHDIRSFLGLCSYYRRFIKDFCHKAEPLQSLLKGDAKFFWGPEQVKAFNNLKKNLTSEPVLGLYDENAPTELHTDASGYGIGAVLVQIHDGKEKVIAYASRTLTKAERNYSTTERECLAAIWAITKFRPYLFGKSFKIVTDHHSLCWLTGLKDPSGRLARWALRLQEYDATVVYKSGKKHKDADSLSRNPLKDNASWSESSICSNIFTNLSEEQMKDPELAKIIRDQLSTEGSRQGNFELIEGVLYKKNFDPSGRKFLPVIPKHLRISILQSLHDDPTAGHLGFTRTYDRVRKRFHWPGLYRNVRRYVMHCRECQRRKSIPQKPPGFLMPIPPSAAPFHRIGIDLLGRFPKSDDGNKWIVVCTDYFTRYAVTKALPTAEATQVAKFLIEDIILKHGAPRVIITDRGQVFQSKLVADINRLCNITHRMTTAYHPQTNGLTERFNKTLADMLSMYVDVEQKNWDQILPFVTFAYNTARQDTTGFSPFYLLHGREAETTLDTMFPLCPNNFDHEDGYVGHLINRAEESRQLARVRTLEAQQKDRRLYDARHRMVAYKPGDLVWIFTPVRKVGLSEKLLKKYFGPYQVVKQLSDVNYEVADFDPTSRRRKRTDVVHVLRMKPYHDPDEQDDQYSEESNEVPEKDIPEMLTPCEDAPIYTGPVTRSRNRAAKL